MAEVKEPVAKPARSRVSRIFFTTFKWCRVSVLLLLLAILVLGVFLNDVGLPGWAERRIQEQFRDLGWDLQFSRLRLRWYRGIVAEDLHLQRTNTIGTPQISFAIAEFRLNWKALQHLDLEANSVLLKEGRLEWPFTETNRPIRRVTLDRVGGELFFHRHDLWELKFLEAELMGMQVRFRGHITNASLIRHWKLPQRPPPGAVTPEVFWNRLLTELEKIRFEGRPELNTVFAGDARDWKSFDVRMKFTAQAVETPWGSGTNLALVSHLLPPARSNELVRADFKLTADQPRTPWGTATNLDLSLVLEPSHTQLLPTNALLLAELRDVRSAQGTAARLLVEIRTAPSSTNTLLNQTRVDVTADQVGSLPGRVARARLIATSVHETTNWLPASTEVSLNLDNLQTSWTTSRWTQLSTRLDLPSLDVWRAGKPGASWAERMRTVPLTFNMASSEVHSQVLPADWAEIKGSWRFPALTLGVETQLRKGTTRMDVHADMETREVGFRTTTRLDPATINPYLSTNVQPWLASLIFQSPPLLESTGRFVLPVTNTPLAWKQATLRALSVEGQLTAGSGAYRDVAFNNVRIPFTLTNETWLVTGLRIARPEGDLELSGSFDPKTGDYRGIVFSGFNLLALRPVFPQPAARRLFNWLEFTGPPRLSVTLSGNSRDLSRLSAGGHVVLTNAAFRGQHVELCTARLAYTNDFLSILDPLVLREGERGRADGIGIDLAGRRLYLTNAIGNIEPRAVTKAIGPGVDKDIAPFVFDSPPAARAEGSIRLGKNDGSDYMRFEVDGGPFHWERFHLEQVRAILLWRGHTLSITNLQGRWRGAKVTGSAHFDLSPGRPDVFSFHLKVDGADLRQVLRDIQPGTSNKVEGDVSGELLITHGIVQDWKSWQGHGQAQLTNGVLWEIPLFGVFSPVLNAFFPGLGNSRAKHAGATFQITNSVIFSDDLEIRATAMRMKYKGAVDFEQRVSGRMEAELLRDMPAFGFLISKVFWPVTKLFEYRITGTLGNPKTEQLYAISKVFLLPFQPIKTLKEIFEQGSEPAEAPADKAPPAEPSRK